MSTKLKAVENPDEEPDVESAAVEFTEELPPLHVDPTSFDARIAGIEPCSLIRELSKHHAGVAGFKVEQIADDVTDAESGDWLYVILCS